MIRNLNMGSSVPEIPGIQAQDFLAHEFRHEVAELLGRSSTNFPGAQPVSFARQHLQELKSKDYYLCEKSDGIRCLLYCTQDENQGEIHYLIDRKNNYYFVPGLHLPLPGDPELVAFHTRTILDGELVNDRLEDGRRELRFLVFDCMVLDGKNLIGRIYDSRIGYFKEHMWEPYQKLYFKRNPQARQSQPFILQWKRMERGYAIEVLFHQLENLAHGNDGLVFTCKDTPYTCGTDEHIFKWKPANENSIDFRLCLGQFPTMKGEDGQEDVEDYDAMPTFDLEVHHNNREYRSFAPLYLTEDEWESMKSLDEQLDGRIIECFKDEEGRWRYKRESDGTPRFRDDKLDGNHISTVEKVLLSIEDAVSKEELLAAAKSIKDSWQQRHPEEARKRVAQGPPLQQAPMKKIKAEQ